MVHVAAFQQPIPSFQNPFISSKVVSSICLHLPLRFSLFNRKYTAVKPPGPRPVIPPMAALPSPGWLSPFPVSVATTLAYQGIFFFITSRLQTDRFTDLAGTSNIALLALLSLAASPFHTQRHIFITVAIVAWAVRLGAFLFKRITEWKSDRRFDQFRGSSAKLAVFWVLQAIWVWVCALPATLLSSAAPSAALGGSDALGLSLYAIGLLLESVADSQKAGARVHGWPEKGLWRFSRHPNYFGEILVWWGIYALALPDLHLAALPALASPLIVTALLMFLSGVPILESGANEKYGQQKEYQDYKKKTSVLLPMPPSFYQRLPHAVKTWILLDLPMYNSNMNSVQASLDDIDQTAT